MATLDVPDAGLRLEGRVLILSDDPELYRQQLDGTDLDCASGLPPLRYGINTDLIINGAACTLGYTPEILGPHFLAGYEGTPIDAVRKGNFQVVVGGAAYGSGSSREVAVTAHQGAGIQLVVAESLQRIFQENLVYAGMSFTTDFGVLERLQAGETILPSTLTETLPPFFRTVVAHGGLLPYASALLEGRAELPYSLERAERPMTAAEKLLARKAVRGPGQPLGVASVEPGDQVLVEAGFLGLHEYTAGMVMKLYESAFGSAPLACPERVACFEDHFALLDRKTVPEALRARRLEPAQRLTEEMLEAAARHRLPLHGPGRERDAGVCHRLVVERYAEPGMVVALTDSHTPTAGVLDTFAYGVGSTAMAFALRTGWLPATVPSSVRVEVKGHPRFGVSPKDLILHVIGDPYFREEQWRQGPSDTCVIEWAGEGLEAWTVDELSVLTNMTVEGGLMTGIVIPCPPVKAFLTQTRPDRRFDFVYPDPSAHYARVIEIDLETLPLTVAAPGDARNRAPLAEHHGTPVQNVVIASCTGGSFEDLRAAAEVLRGRSLAPGLRLTVTPSSAEVSRCAEEAGFLEVFRSLGAEVTDPGCGACIGNGPGIPGPGETTASTTNRNFDRRMGAPGPVYLVSPSVAAATAVTGRLTDPRRL